MSNETPVTIADKNTSPSPRFQTLNDAREHHNALLMQVAEEDPLGDPPDALVRQVRDFRTRLRATGAVLNEYRDRAVAQQMQDFWGDYLYRTRGDRDLVDRSLESFDKAVAETLKDLSDERYPFRSIGRAPQRPADLVGKLGELAERGAELLAQSRLIVVIGPADCGRSSLVRAGIVELWKSRHPGEYDAAGSTSAVVYASAAELDWSDGRPCFADGRQPNAFDEVAAVPRPRSGWGRFAFSLFVVGPRPLPDDPRLLVVDSIEDLLATKSESSFADWCDALVDFAHGPDHLRRVILIARSDQQRLLESSHKLAPLLKESLIRVKARESQEFVDAVARPARVVGLVFETGLIEQLVNDCLGDPAALQWLRFVLRRLWQARDRNWIGWDVYVGLGGADAVNCCLDEYYGGLSGECARVVKRLLLHLVRPATTSAEYRCPAVAIAEMQEQAGNVALADRLIGELVDLQLIDPLDERGQDVELEHACAVRFVHPGIVRRWNLLAGWFREQEDHRQEILGYEELARKWKISHEDRGVLWDSELLVEVVRRRVAEARAEPIPGVGEDALRRIDEFLAASAALIERRRFFRRAIFLSIVAAAAVFATMAYKNWRHWRQSETNLSRAHRAEFEQHVAQDDLAGALVILAARYSGPDAVGHSDDGGPRERMALLARQLVTPQLIARFAGPRESPATNPADMGSERRAVDQGVKQVLGTCRGTVFAQDGSSIVAIYDRTLELHVAADAGGPSRVVRLSVSDSDAPVNYQWQNAAFANGGRFVYAERHRATAAGDSSASADRFQQVVLWTIDQLAREATELRGQVLGDPGQWNDTVVALSPPSARIDVTGESTPDDRQWLAIVRQPPTNDISASTTCEVWRLGRSRGKSGVDRVFGTENSSMPDKVDSFGGKRWTHAALAPVDYQTDSPAFRLVLASSGGQGPVALAWDLSRTGEQLDVQHLNLQIALAPPVRDLTTLHWNPVDSRVLGVTGTLADGISPFSQVWFVPGRRRDAATEKGDDNETLRVLRARELHHSFGRVCAFSPDGATFVTSAGPTVVVWRLQQAKGDGQLERVYLGAFTHEADISSAAFSHDGRFLITGSRDKTARVWSLALGVPVLSPLRHLGTVSTVAFSPDNRLMLTSSGTKTAGERVHFIWPFSTGNPAASVVTTNYPLAESLLSPDGRWYFAPPQEFLLVKAAPTRGEQDASVANPAFYTAGRSPSLARVVWAKRGDLGQFDLAFCDATFGGMPKVADIRAAAFSGKSSHFLLIHSAKLKLRATIWKLPTGTAKPSSADDGSPSNIVAPLADFVLTKADGKEITDAAQGFYRAAVSDVGDVALATIDADSTQGRLRVWRKHEASDARAAVEMILWKAGGTRSTECHSEPVTCLAFSGDGELLASGSEDDSVRIWSTTTARCVEQLSLHSANVHYVRMIPDATNPDALELVTCGADGKAVLSSLRRRHGDAPWVRENTAQEFDHGSSVSSAAISADGRLVATSGDDGRARIWYRATGRSWGSVITAGRIRQVAIPRDPRTGHNAILTIAARIRPMRDPPQSRFEPQFRVGIAIPTSSLRTFALEAWLTEPRAPKLTLEQIRDTAEILAGRRYLSERRIVDLEMREFLERRNAIRSSGVIPSISTAGTSTSSWVQDFNECLHQRQWFGARQLLRQGLADWPEQIDKPAVCSLLARVQSEHAAEAMDGEAACREFELARGAYQEAVHQFEPGKAPAALWFALAQLNHQLGRWQDAADGYGHAITAPDAKPGRLRNYYHGRKATCEAEQGPTKFDAAAIDFSQAYDAKGDLKDSYDPRYSIALIRLAQGRAQEYADECGKLAEEAVRWQGERQPSASDIHAVTNAVAWLGVLSPHSDVDPNQLVKLAQAAVAANPENYFSQSTLGGCQYRLAVATTDRTLRIQRLNDAKKALHLARQMHLAKRLAELPTSADVRALIQLEDGMPYDWLLLAMIEWQLAKSGVDSPSKSNQPGPRYWLDKARIALDPPRDFSAAILATPCSLSLEWKWWQRLEMRLLLNEASALIEVPVSAR